MSREPEIARIMAEFAAAQARAMALEVKLLAHFRRRNVSALRELGLVSSLNCPAAGDEPVPGFFLKPPHTLTP